MNLAITNEIVGQAVGSAALFLLFWQILGKRFFVPFVQLLEEREEKMTGTSAGAVDTRRELERLKDDVAELDREIRTVGVKTRTEISDRAKKEAQIVAQQSTERAQQTILKVRSDIEQMRSKVSAEIDGEAAKVAAQIVEKAMVVGRAIH